MGKREPQVGDVYESRDKRETGRKVVVISIDASDSRKTAGCIPQTPVATCAPWASGRRLPGRLTRIQFHTLAARWRLAQHGAEVAPDGERA